LLDLGNKPRAMAEVKSAKMMTQCDGALRWAARWEPGYGADHPDVARRSTTFESWSWPNPTGAAVDAADHDDFLTAADA